MSRELFIVVAGGGIFFLVILCIIIWNYVILTKLEKAEEYLKNSFEASAARHIWGGSHTGKTMRLGRVAGILLWPNFYCRQGLVDIEEVNKMPRSLKLWILIPARLILTLCLAMFLFWAFGKYKGWID